MCASIIQRAATPSNTPARPLLLARRPMQPTLGQGQSVQSPAATADRSKMSDGGGWSRKAAEEALCGGVCAAFAEAEEEQEREEEQAEGGGRGRGSEEAPPNRRKSNCRSSFGIKGTPQRVLTPHGGHSQPMTLVAPRTPLPLARASFGGGGAPRRSFGGDGGTPRSGFKAPWRI